MQPKTTTLAVVVILVGPGSAWAFQSHPAPEGPYVHQLAHVFFIAAMGVLTYWLEHNRLTRQRGWRFIQVSCMLFVVWNVLTFAGHWVEERVPERSVIGSATGPEDRFLTGILCCWPTTFSSWTIS